MSAAINSPPEPRGGLGGYWDRFIGPGATLAENVLILGGGTVLALLILLYAWLHQPANGWSAGHYAILALLALDIGGGLIANATAVTRRWYQRPGQGVRQHLGFVALHFIHPLLVAWFFRAGDWLYFAVVYGWLLLATFLLLQAPAYLKSPLAYFFTGLAITISLLLFPPVAGLGWFIPFLYLKLLAGHLLPLPAPARTNGR